MRRNVLALGIALVLALATGCAEEEGPAERAGRAMDEAADEIRDLVEDEGPLERAGEKADEAVESARESLKK